MTNDLINQAYVRKPPYKAKRMGLRELPGWVHMEVLGSGTPGEGVGA